MPSESIISKHNGNSPDDLWSLTMHIGNMIPFKLMIFIFLSNIMLQTNSFIESILSKFSGAVDGRFPTEKGILIQTLILVLLFAIVSILIEAGLV